MSACRVRVTYWAPYSRGVLNLSWRDGSRGDTDSITMPAHHFVCAGWSDSLFFKVCVAALLLCIIYYSPAHEHWVEAHLKTKTPNAVNQTCLVYLHGWLWRAGQLKRVTARLSSLIITWVTYVWFVVLQTHKNKSYAHTGISLGLLIKETGGVGGCVCSRFC